MTDIVYLPAIASHRETRFGIREAIATGVLWGVLVTTSETLSQPALYLELNQFLFFYGRILVHYIAGGVALSIFVHWILLRLHSVRAAIAAILAIALATGFSLAVERLTVWFIPVFSSDLMLGLVGDYLDLAVYLSWNFAFFGGAYVVAFFLFKRSTRLRDQLRTAERARLSSEASLDRALAEDHSGLLQPALLIESVAELGRRYTEGVDCGDRLLDLIVRFLRSAMNGLSAGNSDLATELELAGNYASLCRELGRPSCTITIDDKIDTRASAFPSLVLLRMLDELCCKLSTGKELQLNVSQDEGVVVLQIDCAELPLHALSEATERRTGIALRAVAGKGAAIRRCDAELRGPIGTCLEITLPSALCQGQSAYSKEKQSCHK